MTFTRKYPGSNTISGAPLYPPFLPNARAVIGGQNYMGFFCEQRLVVYHPEDLNPNQLHQLCVRKSYLGFCEALGNQFILSPLEKQTFIPLEIAPTASVDGTTRKELLGPLTYLETDNIIHAVLGGPEFEGNLKMALQSLARYADENFDTCNRPQAGGGRAQNPGVRLP